VNPQRWREIEALFDDCIGLEPEARDILLAERCADDAGLRREVEELLAHAEPADHLVKIVDRSREEALAVAGSDRRAGDMVGSYRLESRLGEGGMGSVWRARRADDEFEQQVAIKFVRVVGRDRGWVERFRAERQILARLDHPHIARLLDGGSTDDGQPYLVMELVEGEELLAFCDRRQLAIRERLGLFLQVADAVDHAHRYLIVHRDLKPANILVHPERGPKLLDFGIAKILAVEPAECLLVGAGPDPTLPEDRLLTPDYASPEQILGQAVTTASDVYSLGVLLFELLTGQRPRRLRELTPASRERVLTTSTPEKPSTVVRRRSDGEEPPEGLAARRGLRPPQLVRTLRGDLDTIVLRALQTEPIRRYRSVAELAGDVDRFLAGRPIHARADTWRYRAGRFVRRHPWGAAAAVLIAALSVTFVANLIVHSARLATERDRAVSAEAKARTVSDFLFQLFEGADPSYSRGETVTARELLDRGKELIETRLGDQPEIRAALLSTLADVHLKLGLNSQAAELHREALALRRRLLGESHLDTAASEDRLGDTLRRTTQIDEAETLLRQSLATREAQLAPDDPVLALSLNDLGLLLKERGDPEQAEPLLRRALAIRVARLGRDHHDTNVSRSNLGQLLLDRGRYDEASALVEELIASRTRTLGEMHPDVANAFHVLGSIRQAQGRLDEAEGLLRRAIQIRRAVLPPDHPYIGVSVNYLASVLQDQVRLEEAEGLYREALSIHRREVGETSLELAYPLNNLGSLLEDRGRYAEAEELYLQSLAIRAKAFGEESRSFMRVLSSLGRLAVRRGDLEVAGTRLRRAASWQEKHLEPDDPDRIHTVERLGLLHRAKGALDDSADSFRTAFQLASRGGQPSQRLLAELHSELAWTLAASRQPERCALEVEAARAVPNLAAESVVVRGRIELAAGICLQALGRGDEAKRSLRTALELLHPGLGEANHWVREAARRLTRPKSESTPNRVGSDFTSAERRGSE
jgi:eukaryotic-like serine/threonine-protein kinase